MCGRYSIGTKPEVLATVFKLATMPEPTLFEPRYNVAPTQLAPVIRVDEAGRRTLSLLRWGLIPSWADDPAIGSRMINARCESAAQKPAFRSAFRQRRCLIPADAFYEWQKPAGTRGNKQPFAIRRRDGQPFAMAGLWETWRPKHESQGDEEIETFTILTTDANELVAPLHDRMPVILDPEDFEKWLDPQCRDVESLKAMLRPFPADQMVSFPVNFRMNKPDHDKPDCLEPVKAAIKRSEPETLFE